MTVEKYRKNRLSAIGTAWITAVFTGKLTKSLRNVDNASAHAAVVDEHFRNIDFQLKKVLKFSVLTNHHMGPEQLQRH